MHDKKALKRVLSLTLVLVLIMSILPAMPASVEAAEVYEIDTYVFDRDANGSALYQYQSPCMLGYDWDNKYAPGSVPIQAFVFSMYNAVSGEIYPTYCTDINVTAKQGADYRRLNLEDSPFSSHAAGKIRAILTHGFYIIPIEGESDADHAARVNAKAAEIGAAIGISDFTVGEAIAATQAAIWRTAHGPILTFPKFCRYTFNPTETKYASLCSYNTLRYMKTADIETRVRMAYDYLLALDPIEEGQKTVSSSSFTKLQKPVYQKNADGTYDVIVTATVDVELRDGDYLNVRATLNNNYTALQALSNGTNQVSLTLKNVPSNLEGEKVTLSISGEQSATGFFYFDANGDRQASQSMVGYSRGRLPVYAEVEATDARILRIYKTTMLGTGNNSYVRMPLSSITFDLYYVMDIDEYYENYVSKGLELPEPTADMYSDLAEYTLITDDNGRASINLTHQHMPDAVYLLVERNNPGIVQPLAPQYVAIPEINGEVEIELKLKNEVKGGVRIEKDVISIGNDEASLDAYSSHTWIVGATIPEDLSTGKSYVIEDTLDNRLDYLGNLKVQLEEISGTNEIIALEKDTDYTLEVVDVDSLSADKPSDSFKISLTFAGRSKVATTVTANGFNNYMLRVYFDAQINANAGMGEKIPNQATLRFTNAANFEFKSVSDIPIVYTGGVNLLKVDAANHSNTLAGASFELYRPATVEELAAGGANLEELPGVSAKVVKVSFYDNAAMAGQKVNSVTSGEDGKIIICGLAYGKYYLLETKAPGQYNLLAEPIAITINGRSHQESNAIAVENRKDVVLPTTGGVGTTIFTVGGVSLLCLACLLLYIKKRKFAEN